MVQANRIFEKLNDLRDVEGVKQVDHKQNGDTIDVRIAIESSGDEGRQFLTNFRSIAAKVSGITQLKEVAEYEYEVKPERADDIGGPFKTYTEDHYELTLHLGSQGGGSKGETPEDLPKDEDILLITHISGGRLSAPSIIEGTTSSTGKTIEAPKSKYSDKTVRLDTATILEGEREYRGTRSYQIYTKARFRSLQQSNYAPGPQSGANHVTARDELPEPTHTPEKRVSDPEVTK